MIRHWMCLLLVARLSPAQAERPVAPGWTVPASENYRASIDRKAAHSGAASLSITSLNPDKQGFAVRQRIRADAYRGKRIRLSAWLKPDEAVEGGAIWLRIDMQNGDYILDSMLEVSSRAARGWTRREIVAQVPADAAGISFGLRMIGPGRIWADDFRIETVAPSTPTTTIERRKDKTSKPDYGAAGVRPVNLGFE